MCLYHFCRFLVLERCCGQVLRFVGYGLIIFSNKFIKNQVRDIKIASPSNFARISDPIVPFLALLTTMFSLWQFSPLALNENESGFIVDKFRVGYFIQIYNNNV
jgi:hypothetical protein